MRATSGSPASAAAISAATPAARRQGSAATAARSAASRRPGSWNPGRVSLSAAGSRPASPRWNRPRSRPALWAAVGVEAATGAAPGTRLQARQALDPSRSSQRPSRVGTGSGMQAPRRCRWTATMLAVSPSGSGKTPGLRRCTTSSPIAVATRNVSLMCPPPKGRTAPTPAANRRTFVILGLDIRGGRGRDRLPGIELVKGGGKG